MMPELRLFGNDIELDREKVARVFDVRATLRWELEKAIERSNVSDDDIEARINEAYEKGYDEGKEYGLEEGRQQGYEQREAEEQEAN
jgi:flagellar biosynthesis/type III secretory pathway protein FliH